MKAIHFGAGNVGRGFVGLLLHQAGYELVFADVNAALIDALNDTPTFTVHEVGDGARDHQVGRYRAVNSATEPEELLEELRTADIATTAVGPTILRHIAPHLVAALRTRTGQPLVIMACENAINATDQLQSEMVALCTPEEWVELADRATFANTAVDRIVPGGQAAGLDVTVEVFHEWIIERTPFRDTPPAIPGATFVHELAPYIERKLFTVNTGHAAAAYFGYLAGHRTINEALADPEVAVRVERVLQETSLLLVEKHGFASEEQARYREKILTRFQNPELPDTVERVGRQPLRKLGRYERFIGAAAQLAALGHRPDGLIDAIGALLRFGQPLDPEILELQRMLRTKEPDTLVHALTGIAKTDPLEPELLEIFTQVTENARP